MNGLSHTQFGKEEDMEGSRCPNKESLEEEMDDQFPQG